MLTLGIARGPFPNSASQWSLSFKLNFNAVTHVFRWFMLRICITISFNSNLIFPQGNCFIDEVREPCTDINKEKKTTKQKNAECDKQRQSSFIWRQGSIHLFQNKEGPLYISWGSVQYSLPSDAYSYANNAYDASLPMSVLSSRKSLSFLRASRVSKATCFDAVPFLCVCASAHGNYIEIHRVK